MKDDFISRREALNTYQTICKKFIWCNGCPFLTEKDSCAIKLWINSLKPAQVDDENLIDRDVTKQALFEWAVDDDDQRTTGEVVDEIPAAIRK